MAEHAIIFSGPMVRAIREGCKTQTRRVILPQPPRWLADPLEGGFREMRHVGNGLWAACAVVGTAAAWRKEDTIRCPYGQAGDVLWVREAWAAGRCYDHLPPREIPHGVKIYFDVAPQTIVRHWHKVRPSIHMPRWACRLLLRVTDVRAQRVQEIGDNDAEAEGVPGDIGVSFQAAFVHIWDSLNAGRGYPWNSNPWVWAISFSVIAAAGSGRRGLTGGFPLTARSGRRKMVASGVNDEPRQ